MGNNYKNVKRFNDLDGIVVELYRLNALVECTSERLANANGFNSRDVAKRANDAALMLDVIQKELSDMIGDLESKSDV